MSNQCTRGLSFTFLGPNYIDGKVMFCFLSTDTKSEKTSGVSANWMLAIIAGITGTLVVIILIYMLAKRRQHPPMQYEGIHLKLKRLNGIRNINFYVSYVKIHKSLCE